MTPPICLSIAGFDGSAGAGLLADIKTFAALGCYGTSVITAVTSQNTQGVAAIHPLSGMQVTEQLQVVCSDMPPAAIKIGMVFSLEIMQAIHAFVVSLCDRVPVILDPVMVATSGDSLFDQCAIEFMRQELLPLVTLITPNAAEARLLLGESISKKESLAKQLVATGVQAALVTQHNGIDEWCDGTQNHRLVLPEIHTRNTHGTGCSLSSAIAACMARGEDSLNAVAAAKNYVWQAIDAAKNWQLGQGHGPLNHFIQVHDDVTAVPIA